LTWSARPWPWRLGEPEYSDFDANLKASLVELLSIWIEAAKEEGSKAKFGVKDMKSLEKIRGKKLAMTCKSHN
jgi:hypothetical protein